jgi:hypothetical protein
MYRGVIVLIPVSEACLNFAQPFFLSFFLSFFDVMEGFKNLKIGRPWNLLSKMSYAV